MPTDTDSEEIILKEFQNCIPHIVTDCVVFGFHDGELKILLLKWKHLHEWSLPGGPIRFSETVDAAAHRILKDRTGLDHIFLQQYFTFGALDRKERMLQRLFNVLGTKIGKDFWLLDRVVSIGYYALVDFSEVIPTPDFLSEECRWWELDQMPDLLFDHGQMVQRALNTLRLRLTHLPIGINLLPEKFTMSELQRLYETILGKSLDRRNFQKKMLNVGILERLKERRTGVAHRQPYLYRFDIEQYDHVIRDGLSLR